MMKRGEQYCDLHGMYFGQAKACPQCKSWREANKDSDPLRREIVEGPSIGASRRLDAVLAEGGK